MKSNPKSWRRMGHLKTSSVPTKYPDYASQYYYWGGVGRGSSRRGLGKSLSSLLIIHMLYIGILVLMCLLLVTFLHKVYAVNSSCRNLPVLL